jgi:ABC-2 type transport system permease protein
MRLVADEKRLGIFELLVSTPVSDWALIAGKALGVGVLTALLALSILIYPYTASQLGAIEWGIVISGTLGLVFLTVAYTCFGVFASCLSDNPIIAAIVALGGLLLFAFLAYIGPNNSHFLSNALRGFSFGLRQKEFFNGMLRFEDFLYLVFFSGFWLFAAVRVIEARRWKQ